MRCTIIDAFFNILDAVSDAEKVPHDYGTGQLLYASELTMLEAIAAHDSPNAMALSRHLNVTRAAITQMGNKLEEKGFIRRFAREGNRKERCYELTDVGRTLRLLHQQHHAQANLQMREYLCALSETDAAVLMQFFDKVMELMPICSFDCGHKEGACMRHTEQ